MAKSGVQGQKRNIFLRTIWGEFAWEKYLCLIIAIFFLFDAGREAYSISEQLEPHRDNAMGFIRLMVRDVSFQTALLFLLAGFLSDLRAFLFRQHRDS